MIKTLSELKKALRGNKPKFAGVLLYAGPSQLNGKPIVAIASRIFTASNNEKTGSAVQTFIICADEAPHVAIKQGLDEAVCGDCPHRGQSCYVDTAKSVLSVYGAFSRSRYAIPGIDFDAALIPALFAGLDVRLGTYGDPAAVPFQVWRGMTLKARSILGYCHQWAKPEFQAYKLLCMASCDTEAQAIQAEAMGWRVFRVRSEGEAKRPGEVVCPASNEAGNKTQCASCKACGGHSAKARASIVIFAHGPVAKVRAFERTQRAIHAQEQAIGLAMAAE